MVKINKYEGDSFCWEILEDCQWREKIYQFPRETSDFSHKLLLQVIPAGGDEWFGNFIGIDKTYFSGVVNWPDGNHICVVSEGVAFVVSVTDPNNYYELNEGPVMNVIEIDGMKMVIFATYSEIISYEIDMKLWETRHLAIDGIVLTEIKEGHLFGIADNILRKDKFKVDLKTGKYIYI